MDTELVTVVMPVYNADRFLREAVDSVVSQTYRNWELLILDDCSTDKSLQIAHEYEQMDCRIRVVESEHNSGVAKVRNRGIREAKGEYIAFLDSDDIWTPDKLEKQVELAKQANANVVYCSYDFLDENSVQINKPFIVPAETNYKKMLACNVIGCSAAMVDSRLLKQHPFNVNFYHEDYVLWMELLSIPGVVAAGDTQVLMHYRRVSGSRSNNKEKAAKERWNIYRKALGLSFTESIWAFAKYTVNGILKYYL